MAAALLAAPACITLDDLSMPEDAGEDAETEDAQQVEVDPDEPDLPDESDTGDAPSVRDARVEGDASTEPLDAHVDAALVDSWVGPDVQSGCSIFQGNCSDVGPPVVDGTVPIEPDVQPFVCHSNAECGAEQFCLAEACQPRCNVDGACIVHQVPAGRTIAQFASDDQALYFSYTGGELWRREPDHTATLLTDQIGPWGDFVVLDGYAYFHRGSRFFRIKVTPESPAEELYVVPGSQDTPWTIGNGFLVASVPDGFWFGNLDGTQTLRKIESELVGTPLDVHASGDRFYFTAKTRVNDSELLRVKSVRMVEPYAIEDASPVLSSWPFDGNLVEVRPPYAYFGWRSPQRVHLQTGEIETLSGASAPGHSLDSRFRISGDWVYSYNPGYENPAGSSIDRYFLGKPSIAQQIQPPRPAGQSAAGMIMEVVGKRFYSSNGSVIYEKTLAPAPCESQAQCETDEFCGPDAKCIPRCASYGACFAYEAERPIQRMASDDQALYFSLGARKDAVGTSLEDGELWRMRLGHAPERVTNQLSDGSPDFVLHKGYAYYQMRTQIVRVALHPIAPPQVVQTLPGSITSWVVGDDFIAASSGGTTLVGSLDQTNPMAPLLPEDKTIGAYFLAHGDRIYFGRQQSSLDYRMHSVQMTQPYTVEALAPISSRGFFMIEPPFAYFFAGGPGQVARTDLRDGTTSQVSNADPVLDDEGPYYTFGSATIIGSWLYAIEERDYRGKGAKVHMGRYSLAKLGVYQELSPVLTRGEGWFGPGSQLATASGKLYFTAHSLSTILYEWPLPPEPCAADLPCPTGKTCGTDNLCH